jgi:hypothetical protein
MHYHIYFKYLSSSSIPAEFPGHSVEFDPRYIFIFGYIWVKGIVKNSIVTRMPQKAFKFWIFPAFPQRYYIPPNRMHSGMLDAFVKTVMGFLTSPAEAFKQVEGKTVGAAYQYYAMLVLIFSILFGAVTMIMGSIMLNSHVQEIAMLPLIGSVLSANLAKFGTFIATTQLLVAYVVFLALLFGVFFVGFFLHMFVLLMDGKKSIWETVKTTMFASTPLLLIGWIPYIGVIGGIWSFVLVILGFRDNNGLSLEKSVIAAILPIVLWWILMILGLAMVTSFFGALQSLVPAMFK